MPSKSHLHVMEPHTPDTPSCELRCDFHQTASGSVLLLHVGLHFRFGPRPQLLSPVRLGGRPGAAHALRARSRRTSADVWRSGCGSSLKQMYHPVVLQDRAKLKQTRVSSRRVIRASGSGLSGSDRCAGDSDILQAREAEGMHLASTRAPGTLVTFSA